MEPGRKGVPLGGFVILVAFARCSQINKKSKVFKDPAISSMFRQIRNHFEFLKYNQADPIFQNVLEILKMTAKLEKRGTSTTPSC